MRVFVFIFIAVEINEDEANYLQALVIYKRNDRLIGLIYIESLV